MLKKTEVTHKRWPNMALCIQQKKKKKNPSPRILWRANFSGFNGTLCVCNLDMCFSWDLDSLSKKKGQIGDRPRRHRHLAY